MKVLTNDQIMLNIVPILLNYCKDPVPNVRFGTIKILTQILEKLDQTTVVSKIKPILLEMAKDADRDVKYFAKQALTLC